MRQRLKSRIQKPTLKQSNPLTTTEKRLSQEPLMQKLLTWTQAKEMIMQNMDSLGTQTLQSILTRDQE